MPEDSKQKQVDSESKDSKDEPVVEVLAEDGSSESAKSMVSAAPPTSFSSTEKTAKSSEGPFRMLGVLGALAGVGLAVGAQMVEPLAAYQMHSGTLIVGGLVLFGVGVVRRTLAGIRSTVDCVSNETLRLEQLTLDNKSLRDNVTEVRDVTSELRGDVDSLHEQIEQLVTITSDSDFQTSIFQLAASLDQVGAKLDVAMKERFQALQEDLQKLSEHADQSGGELSAQLKEMGEQLKEQEQVWQLGHEESFERLKGTATETHQRLDENLKTLERFERLLAEGLGSVTENATVHGLETTAGFEDLRGHVAQQVEGQTNALHERLDGIEGRFNRIDRDHASAMGQLAERLERELTSRTEALQESLRTIEQLASQKDDDRTAEFEHRVREQLEGIRDVVREAAQSAGETSSEVGAGMAELGARIELVVDQRYDALSTGLTAVVECATETAVNVQNLMAEVEQAAARELAMSEPQAPETAELPEPASELPAGYEVHDAWAEQPYGPAPQEAAMPEPLAQEPEPFAFEVPAEPAAELPHDEPPAALPQMPATNAVEDPWAPAPAPAPQAPYVDPNAQTPPQPPEFDPLANPFQIYDDRPQGQ